MPSRRRAMTAEDLEYFQQCLSPFLGQPADGAGAPPVLIEREDVIPAYVAVMGVLSRADCQVPDSLLHQAEQVLSSLLTQYSAVLVQLTEEDMALLPPNHAEELGVNCIAETTLVVAAKLSSFATPPVIPLTQPSAQAWINMAVALLRHIPPSFGVEYEDELANMARSMLKMADAHEVALTPVAGAMQAMCTLELCLHSGQASKLLESMLPFLRAGTGPQASLEVRLLIRRMAVKLAHTFPVILGPGGHFANRTSRFAMAVLADDEANGADRAGGEPVQAFVQTKLLLWGLDQEGRPQE